MRLDSSVSMTVWITSGSVPSTAIWIPSTRNGSSTFSIMFSRARMPSRRAVSASSTSWRMSCCGTVLFQSTVLSITLGSPRNRTSGKLVIVAAVAPPTTMSTDGALR